MEKPEESTLTSASICASELAHQSPAIPLSSPRFYPKPPFLIFYPCKDTQEGCCENLRSHTTTSTPICISYFAITLEVIRLCTSLLCRRT
jgi:hypothetical protein